MGNIENSDLLKSITEDKEPMTEEEAEEFERTFPKKLTKLLGESSIPGPDTEEHTEKEDTQ